MYALVLNEKKNQRFFSDAAPTRKYFITRKVPGICQGCNKLGLMTPQREKMCFRSIPPLQTEPLTFVSNCSSILYFNLDFEQLHEHILSHLLYLQPTY